MVLSAAAAAALWLVAAACDRPSPEEDINLLKSQHAEVREKAAGRLVLYGQEIVPRLTEETGSGHTTVRFEVARLLGRLRDPRAAKALVWLLDDKSANVWQMAAWALGEIRAPEAVPKLLESTDSVSRGIRAEAIRGLGLCYTDSAWGCIRDSVYGEIVKALRDPAPKVRIAALQSARQFGYRDAGAQIIRLTRDPTAEVRYVAVQALGQLAAGDAPGAPEPLEGSELASAVEALLAQLDEPFQSIRTKVVRALEQIGASQAVPHLERLRRDGTPEDVREATRVLEKLAAPPPPTPISIID